MNIADSIIVLRPRTLSETLDLACRVTATSALGLYLRLAAVALLPGFALCMLLRHALAWAYPGVWLVALAWGTVAQGVFTVAAGQILFAPSVTAREVLRPFGRRLFSYLGALALSRALLAVCTLPMFLLVPSGWVRVLFVHEASLLEGARAYEATKRSARFVKGRGMEVFQVLLAIVLAQAGFVAVAELLGHGLIDDVLQLGKPFGSLVDDGGSPLAVLGLLASIPFVATARFLHYIDTRTRADGWDVQVRFMAIAAKDAEEGRRDAA